jgi:hypothetical protein
MAASVELMAEMEAWTCTTAEESAETTALVLTTAAETAAI